MTRALFIVFVLMALLTAAPTWADPLTSWTAGPGATQPSTYDGAIDTPSANATVSNGSLTVAGWFVDRSAEGWAGADDVQVWQGTMDGGGKMLAEAIFAQNRPDVAAAEGNPFWAASGFSAVVPSGSLTAGQQTLSVYAHTPGNGWWYEQVPINVTSAPVAASAPASGSGGLPVVVIETPKDSETVLTKSDYTIIGYALDPSAAQNQGTGIDTVAVYLGDRDNGGTFLGNADLGGSDSTAEAQYGSQFASAGWRLTFKPTNFHANTYLLYAYAHSAITGKEDNAVRYFAIREHS